MHVEWRKFRQDECDGCRSFICVEAIGFAIAQSAKLLFVNVMLSGDIWAFQKSEHLRCLGVTVCLEVVYRSGSVCFMTAGCSH